LLAIQAPRLTRQTELSFIASKPAPTIWCAKETPDQSRGLIGGSRPKLYKKVSGKS